MRGNTARLLIQLIVTVLGLAFAVLGTFTKAPLIAGIMGLPPVWNRDIGYWLVIGGLAAAFVDQWFQRSNAENKEAISLQQHNAEIIKRILTKLIDDGLHFMEFIEVQSSFPNQLGAWRQRARRAIMDCMNREVLEAFDLCVAQAIEEQQRFKTFDAEHFAEAAACVHYLERLRARMTYLDINRKWNRIGSQGE